VCVCTLCDDVNEDFHAADEDGGERFDLLEAAHQNLPVHLVGEFFLARANLPRHL
jgi:hypothetical protein